MHVLTGRVWPAMFTPLDASGEPNLRAVERLVDLFAEQQLGGLFILGTTGQGLLLNFDERRRVAERVVEASAGRIAIMVHIGALATRDAVALARHAAEIGADAVSSVPPIYYPTSTEATFEHYRALGAATDLPFFPYHAAFLRQSLPGPAEYAERLLEIPHIAGMKFTDHDLYLLGLLHHNTSGRLHIFSGADELLCHAAMSGAVGAVGTFYNQWGPACQRARAAFVGGDFDAGRRFMLAFQQVIHRVLSSGSMWAFHRASMQLKYDIDIGPPRQPLAMTERSWDDAEVERLLETVETAAPR